MFDYEPANELIEAAQEALVMLQRSGLKGEFKRLEDAVKGVEDAIKEADEHQTIIEEARAAYTGEKISTDGNNIQIDDHPVIAASDNGWFISAWVWVEKDVVGITELFDNHYRCYKCKHEWVDRYSAQPDDDCPQCGARHCTPYQSDTVPCLNTWPRSQACIGCQHGELALDVDESSAYYCELGIRPNRDGECDKREDYLDDYCIEMALEEFGSEIVPFVVYAELSELQRQCVSVILF